MTRPLKENGVSTRLLDAITEHQRHAQATCERKMRYPDEFVARGIGTDQMQRGFASCQLFIYKCKWCRGWHLTKQELPPYFAADYFEKNK